MKRRVLLKPVTLGKNESSNEQSDILPTVAVILTILLLIAGTIAMAGVIRNSVKARAAELTKEIAAQPLTASAVELQTDLNKKYNLNLSKNQVKQLDCVVHRTGPKTPSYSTCFTNRLAGATHIYGTADVTKADGSHTSLTLVSQAGEAALIPAEK